MVTAAAATSARAVRIALPGTVSAAQAALLVDGDPHPFALVGRWGGAAALVGSDPVRLADPADDPFALLDDQPSVSGAPAGFVGGGWFGMLGYGLGARLEALAPAPHATERLPDAALAFHDHLLRLDAEGRWWFEALWTEARAAVLERRLDLLRARVDIGVREPGPVATGPWTPSPTPTGHARAVAAAQERIGAGDLFQANLSLRLRARLDGSAADLFCHGVARLAPDRAALVAGPWGAVASLSPELFVSRHGDVVRSAPIKGTRPRPADPAAAAVQRDALVASSKDRAENVMIVDLVRNDLGRVCVPGSVRVDALAQPQPHTGVWHLVSEVVGQRRQGVGDGELVMALFPPGSVTGAPKLAAMDVISELEGTARQAFCGAIGFASPTAGLELSVAIRTFEVREGHVWLDVGGGIVADSDPEAEAAECLAKAQPLLAAIDGRIDVTRDAGGAAVPRPARLGPRPVPRPDPAAGIFETILVEDGAAVALDDHLARLRTSARALYGTVLPEELPAVIARAALLAGALSRLRVHMRPDGQLTVQAAELPEPGSRVTLAPVTVAGGLGGHKWSDRRLIDAHTAAVAPALPLLVDLDGLVLETSRANILVVIDDTLVTPPLDGRILPGVTRARLLRGAAAAGIEVVERPVALAELDAGAAAYLTGALRGVEAVAGCGAAELRIDDRLATRLRAALSAQNAVASANGYTAPAPRRRS